MKKSSGMYIFIVMVLVLAYSSFAGEMKISVSNEGVLEFGTPEIKFQNSRPAVNFYTGDELIEWKPNSKPAKEVSNRVAAGNENATDHTFTWQRDDGIKLAWAVSKLKDKPGFTVRAYFTNGSDQVVRLQNFHIGSTTKFECAGDPAKWLLDCPSYFSRRYGTLAQDLPSEKKLNKENAYIGRAFVPEEETERYEDGSWRYFKDVITLYRNEGPGKEAKGLVISAVGPGVADVFLNFRVEKGKITNFEMISQMDGIHVDPGETRESEEVVVCSDNYHDALKMAYESIAVTHGSRTDKGEIFGWCSWYGPYNRISEERTLRVAKAVKEQRELIPMQTIQLDDKWQIRGSDWEVNKEVFPNGMRPAAEAIEQAGAMPGLWLCIMKDTNKRIHPDSWYIEGEHLDIGNPEVEAWVRETLKKYYDMGYRYWKFDFNYYGNNLSVNQKWTRFQHFRKWYEVIRDVLKEDSYILACVGNFERSLAGIVDAMRIGSDVPIKWNVSLKSDGRPTHPRCFWFNFQTAASSALANGIVIANDPDVTYARYDTGKHTEMVRGWHSYVGLLGGSQIVSDTIDESERFHRGTEDMRMMEIIHPASPDKGWSMQGGIDERHRQLGFVTDRPWGQFASIVIYNPDISETKNMSLDTWWTQKKLDAEKFYVWSFWDEQYMGIGTNRVDGVIAEDVAPQGGCKQFRLTPIKDQPTIIGSTLHIAMGSAELKNVLASDNGIKIELNPTAGAYDGRLYIYSEKPLAMNSATGMDAFAALVEKNVYVVVLNERQRNKAQAVELVTTNDKVLTLEDVKADKVLLEKYNLAGFKKL